MEDHPQKVKRMSLSPRSGKALGTLLACLVLVMAGLLVRSAFSIEGSTAETSSYVGAETCMACHEDYFKSFSGTLHAKKMDRRTPAAAHECESCHGPGSAHAEAGGGRGVGGILALSAKSSLPSEKKNEVCLQCHDRRKLVNWHGSAHEERGLACTSCHSLHGGNAELLAKPTVVEVCTQCHKKVGSDLLKASHHPVREGKMTCASCHNPHGTVAPKLVDADSVNEKCYECHTEKRGPLLWEHPPSVEDCATCHTPHGSNHTKLLTQKAPFLCQSCHSQAQHPGTLYARNANRAGSTVYTNTGSSGNPTNRMYNNSCLNCHSQIHGSNHPSGKAYLR